MQGPGYLSPDSRGLPLTRTLTRSHLVGGVALGLALMSGAGCQSTHAVAVRADGAPQYDQAKVVYEVSQSQLDVGTEPVVKLEFAKSHPLKAAIAGYEESRTLAAPARPVSRLTIQYPHPDGDPDLVHASLEQPSEAGDYQEVATTDLQRYELDLLLVNLVNGGAFESDQRPTGDTQVAVEIDGVSMHRRWTKEPRLDRLVAETYDARSAGVRP